MFKNQSIVELDAGVVGERLDVELRKVAKNLQDVNTTDVTRKIELSISFKPLDESRRMCAIEIAANSKLAPYKPYKTQGTPRFDSKGDPCIVAESADQQEFDFNEPEVELKSRQK